MAGINLCHIFVYKNKVAKNAIVPEWEELAVAEENSEFILRLAAVSDAADVVSLRLALMKGLALSGISGAYFLAPLTADPRVGRMLTSIGLSRIWERRYRSYLHLIDPLPNLSLNQSGAFAWPEATDKAELTRHQQRYMALAARFGLARGIGTACYGPHGRSGFLGAAWPFDEPPPLRDIHRVHALGQTSFQRYCQLIRSDSEVPALSNRELEVLSWMASGKSNGVIAEILGISSSTVDVYARRIYAKLGVSDRTEAALRAFSYGLIVTSDYRRMVEEAAEREPPTRT